MVQEQGAVAAESGGVMVAVGLGMMRVDLGQMRSTWPPDLGLAQARGRPVPGIRPGSRVDNVRPLAHTPRVPGVIEVYCGQQDCHNQECHDQDYGCGCALRGRHFSPVMFGLWLAGFRAEGRKKFGDDVGRQMWAGSGNGNGSGGGSE